MKGHSAPLLNLRHDDFLLGCGEIARVEQSNVAWPRPLYCRVDSVDRRFKHELFHALKGSIAMCWTILSTSRLDSFLGKAECRSLGSGDWLVKKHPVTVSTRIKVLDAV